jgi:Fic family protein
MRTFSYEFLKENAGGSQVFQLAEIINDIKIKETNSSSISPSLYALLRHNARVDSVKYSSAIEGVGTSDERLLKIVDGSLSPSSHNESELRGYNEALDYIFSFPKGTTLDMKIILHLHYLLKRASYPLGAGKLKVEPNLVTETHEDGSKKVLFVPPSPSDTPVFLKQALIAYYEGKGNASLPSLLLIPSFILDFVSIHPFADGNGRISRLLSVFLLDQAGYDVVRTISFEKVINDYKRDYYEAEMKSQTKWVTNQNDYHPFILNFIQTLYYCYKKLNEKMLYAKSPSMTREKAVGEIIANSLVPLSKNEILDYIPDASMTTVELALSSLQKEGKIIKIGTYRNAKYLGK